MDESLRSRKPLESRDDIQILVEKFYTKVQQDSLIGPIFNDVAQVDWEEHLPKITNFWCDLLLGEETYRGRPFPPHIPLNLEPAHFDRWLQLFLQTVDELYFGLKAEEAKARALRIARNFMANISFLKK